MRIVSNINKLAAGGGLPPFVSYTNVPEPGRPDQQSQPEQPAQATSEGGAMLDKDMIKMLYEKGLPSDVEQFIEQSGLFSNSLFSNPFEKNNGAAKFKSLLKILPRIKMNKDEYERVIKKATADNTLKETAIDTDGRVFAVSDGKVVKKTLSELEEGEQTLTVGQIAENRAYSSSLAFDTNAITAIGNSTSIEQINKTVWDEIKSLGSNTLVKESFVSKDEAKAKAGIDKILEEGADGTYKITSKTISQDTQARYALEYIITKLPANQKVLLQDYARKAGMDLRTGPAQILGSMIQSGISSTQELGIQYDKQATIGKKADTNNTKTRDFDIPMMIVTGNGLPQQKFQIGYNDYAMEVTGQKLPFIPDSSGKAIPPSSLLNALGGQLGNLVNKDAVHVGEQRIDVTQLGQLYYDGSGVATMELPYTLDEHGQPLPNYDIIEAYRLAINAVKEEGKPSKQRINEIFQENGLNRYYKSDGTLNTGSFMRFAGISVVGDDETFTNPDKYGRFFTALDDDRLSQQVSATLGTARNPMEMDDLFRGMAYIPIYESPSLAGAASGNFSWVSDEGAMTEIAKEQQLKRVQDSYNNNITKSDFLNGQ